MCVNPTISYSVSNSFWFQFSVFQGAILQESKTMSPLLFQDVGTNDLNPVSALPPELKTASPLK